MSEDERRRRDDEIRREIIRQEAVSPNVLLWVAFSSVLAICLTIYGVVALLTGGGC